MRKFIIPIIVSFLLQFSATPQTSGTMSFSVSLTAHQGGYGTQHVVAIWIVDSANTFIKTNLRMANSNHTINNHLNTWKASSNLNVVDAVTGATMTSYTSPIIISWNGSDFNKQNVKDGNYTLWIEESWDDGANSTSKTSIVFKKSTDSVIYTPANTSNFVSMSLKWVPSKNTTDVPENKSDNSISVYPNPVSSTLNFHFGNFTNIEKITITDLQGKIIRNIPVSKAVIGDLPIKVQGIKNGVYLVSVISLEGNSCVQKQMVFSK
jgi:hypothetical protein